MAGNEKRGMGRLAAQFRELTSFNESDRRQMVGSAVAIGTGYVGVGALCAVNPAMMQLVVKDFQISHLPLHAVFMLVCSAIGATAVAAYDGYREKKTKQQQQAAPAAPQPPKPVA